MIKRLTYLIAFSCLIGQGCNKENRKPSTSDASIIKLTIQDWFADSGARENWQVYDNPGSDLLVCTPTFDKTTPLEIEVDVEPNKMPNDIVESFTKRNLHTYRLTDINIENDHIKILVPPYDLTNYLGEFERKYPDAKGYIRVSIPGYSPDKESAMIRFQAGPSHHGVSVTYFLKKLEGSWKIQWRDISHYK